MKRPQFIQHTIYMNGSKNWYWQVRHAGRVTGRPVADGTADSQNESRTIMREVIENEVKLWNTKQKRERSKS